jgi:hypothetical protein
MPYAHTAIYRLALQHLSQVAQFAGFPANLYRAAPVNDSQAGRVITSVFQLAQSIQHDGRSRLLANITNNATHGQILLRYSIIRSPQP